MTRALLPAFVAGATLILLLSSCASTQLDFSNVRALQTPALAGVLVGQGQPLVDQRVVLAYNEGENGRCERPLAETRTAVDGSFGFPAIARESRSAALKQLENDWQVCVEQETGMLLIWFDRHAGVLFSEGTQELDCDTGASRQLACSRSN